MSTRQGGEDVPVRRIDRILAAIALGLMLLSVVCFLSIMIGTASGMSQPDFGSGVWPIVTVVVYVAPILAFVCLMTVVIMAFVRRSRANKGR